ncbi:MAG: dTDP-4-dehydrorhamnose reductase [Luteolibacter sp.]
MPRFHHGYAAGQGVRIHPMTNLYGCYIGDWTKIGAFVEIQDGVSSGQACKISSHSFICAGVTIEDGRLGRALTQRVSTAYPVHPISRNQLDLSQPDKIAITLKPIDFHSIIIAAAMTSVDFCESNPNEANAVNAIAPGIIAEIAAVRRAQVFYLSTDHVFDGTKSTAYNESDTTRPINVYGASKLAGERHVLAASPDHLVVRTSWVFGPERSAFPDWIIRQARDQNDLSLPDDKIGNPSYTRDLADWIFALIRIGKSEVRPHRVPHLCNEDPCTWREWGQYCIDTARHAKIPIRVRKISGIPLESVAAFRAKRPLNSALDTSCFTSITGIKPRNWRRAVREFILQNSKKLS